MKSLILSEEDYEILTKCIAIGAFIGIIIGAILDDVILYFALGGVIGIISSVIISNIRNLNLRKNNIKDIISRCLSYK